MDNFEFFVKSDLSNFMGTWVAILDGKVVAHGKNFKEVAEKVDKEFPKKRALLTKVSEKMARIL